MRWTATLLCFSLCLITHSQTNELGVTGGVSICRLQGNTIFEHPDPVMAFQTGIQYHHWTKKGFGIQAQLRFARMEASQAFYGFNEMGDRTSSGKIVYRFDHVGLALGGAYKTPGRVHGLLFLGVMPTLISAAQVRTPDSFLQPGNVVITDLTSKVNSPVVFAYGAFGVGWDLKAPLTLGLLVRYDQGLTTLSKDDFFENEFLLESAWTAAVTVCYRWRCVKD